MLETATVADYLEERGVLPPHSGAVVSALEGGVSCEVFAVTGAGVDVVVKQARPRLRVAEEWYAKVERVVTEAAALRLAALLVPGAVPPVVDVDPTHATVTIGRAPSGWRNWKQELLAGRASPAVAAGLGEALAVWHTGTAGDAVVAARFDDIEAFVQLRVDPYHRTSAARTPAVVHAVDGLVERMLATRRCLVHGDFSPKNVLASGGGGKGLWVLDWEVAHVGDPAFDLAFLLNHLLLKSLHRPSDLTSYRACAQSFLAAYEAGAGLDFAGGEAHLVAHVGCLLLARVVGKSPAEYLTEDQRAAARGLAVATLLDPPSRWEELWDAIA